MHTQSPPITIERKAEVLNRTGFSRSTLYLRIKQGLIPPPISIGDRAVGWIDYEITAVLKAFIAGKTHDEIRLLVRTQVDSRRMMA